LHTVPVTPEEVGFPGAAQIGKLRTRVRGCRRRSQETRYLITSASNERLDALGLLNAKRDYWAIESALHYRLDDTLDEDESRVRRGSAAHILGRCRRLVVGFACAWLRKVRRKIAARARAIFKTTSPRTASRAPSRSSPQPPLPRGSQIRKNRRYRSPKK